MPTLCPCDPPPLLAAAGLCAAARLLNFRCAPSVLVPQCFKLLQRHTITSVAAAWLEAQRGGAAMQSAAAADFLEQLAETAPKAYLQRQPSGQSLLRELYAHAAEAGLLPAGAGGDDIARLHALFDVALDHGMGGLVRDYVAEVRRAYRGAYTNRVERADAVQQRGAVRSGCWSPLPCLARRTQRSGHAPQLPGAPARLPALNHDAHWP